jgi:UDP-N-acetylglucosamine 3-dehydrogenase
VSAPRVGVLILGCGWAARLHARVLRRLPGVELFFASRDADRARAYARRYGGRWSFGSYETALTHAGVDVALVATPTATHAALARLALAAGKHVVVEKPAFMTVAELDDVAAAAHAAGREVLVAENYVYKPLTRFLRRAVLRGDLGDVRFVSVNATKRQPAAGWRADPAASGGGALFEAGVHWIAFLAALGLEPVEARGWRVGGGRGPDASSLVVLRYAGGAVATLAHSWELPAPLGGLRLSKLQGTRGAVTFESNGFFAAATGRRPALWAPAGGDPLGYRAMHADFLRCVRTGAPPRLTLALARRDLALLEAAQRGLAGDEAAPPPARGRRSALAGGRSGS